MEDEKKNNKNAACLGQIILVLVGLAILYGLGDFLKTNKEFSYILFLLICIWLILKNKDHFKQK